MALYVIFSHDKLSYLVKMQILGQEKYTGEIIFFLLDSKEIRITRRITSIFEKKNKTASCQKKKHFFN